MREEEKEPMTINQATALVEAFSLYSEDLEDIRENGNDDLADAIEWLLLRSDETNGA